MRKALIGRFLHEIEDEKIRQIANEVAQTETKDIILLFKKRYTIASFLEMLESWLRVSGFGYSYEIDDNLRSLVIQHEMGRKWSLYMAEVLRNVMQDLIGKETKFEMTENSVSFDIELDRD